MVTSESERSLTIPTRLRKPRPCRGRGGPFQRNYPKLVRFCMNHAINDANDDVGKFMQFYDWLGSQNDPPWSKPRERSRI